MKFLKISSLFLVSVAIWVFISDAGIRLLGFDKFDINTILFHWYPSTLISAVVCTVFNFKAFNKLAKPAALRTINSLLFLGSVLVPCWLLLVACLVSGGGCEYDPAPIGLSVFCMVFISTACFMVLTSLLSERH